jgi:hypothetical protein
MTLRSYSVPSGPDSSAIQKMFVSVSFLAGLGLSDRISAGSAEPPPYLRAKRARKEERERES